MSKRIALLSIRLGGVFSIAWTLLLLGCSSSTSTPTAQPPPPTESPTPTAAPTLSHRIDEAESLWNAQGITDYRIEVKVGSSWSSYVYTVTVADGEVAEAAAICLYEDAFGSDCPPPETFDAEEFMVPGLFARIRSYVGSDAEDWVEVTFDEDAGYPWEFEYDEPESIDEEWGWDVTAFAVLNASD